MFRRGKAFGYGGGGEEGRGEGGHIINKRFGNWFGSIENDLKLVCLFVVYLMYLWRVCQMLVSTYLV